MAASLALTTVMLLAYSMAASRGVVTVVTMVVTTVFPLAEPTAVSKASKRAVAKA